MVRRAVLLHAVVGCAVRPVTLRRRIACAALVWVALAAGSFALATLLALAVLFLPR